MNVSDKAGTGCWGHLPLTAAKLKQALSAYEDAERDSSNPSVSERTETQKINRLKTLEKALKSHA